MSDSAIRTAIESLSAAIAADPAKARGGLSNPHCS